MAGYTTSSLDGFTNAGSNDLYIMKFSDSGSWQWTDQRGSSNDDQALGMEVALEV